MKSLNSKLELLVKHLMALDATFSKSSNYSEAKNFAWYKHNYDRFETLATQVDKKYSKVKVRADEKGGTRVDLSFADEIYNQNDRQMKLADIIEYMFFSRGIYYLFQSNTFKEDRVPIFLELILRFVNLLMTFEDMTVDTKLRDAYLNNIKKIAGDDIGYEELHKWTEVVGLPKGHQKANAPSKYFDSTLPKTAGGLWHEMLVYAYVLKYDIGYIFSLLLTQKPVALRGKLSPPDLIVLHKKTFRYYGIEIGNLKERQSGGFMAPSGLPVIPIDTLNARISDRCPSCRKWIGICENTIQDFRENQDTPEPKDEVRCLVECKLYTLEEKLDGKCPTMKFSYGSKLNGGKYPFCNNKHYHYQCCLTADPNLKKSIRDDKKFKDLQKYAAIAEADATEDEKQWAGANEQKLKSKFNYLKTHSVYYQELNTLIKMNADDANTLDLASDVDVLGAKKSPSLLSRLFRST